MFRVVPTAYFARLSFTSVFMHSNDLQIVQSARI